MNRNCLVCGEGTDTLMVGAIEGGSGPGRILYACRPHAREFAARPDAPQWLKNNFSPQDIRGGDGGHALVSDTGSDADGPGGVPPHGSTDPPP